MVRAGESYLSTVLDDPRLLYQDILVALDATRGINNGQPTLHAECLLACAPRPGETVIHVGAGTGYYTAILADLVGSDGRVIAFEIQSDIASRASNNLRHLQNVSLSVDSAAAGHLPKCDLIYVNAGATHPVPEWLDALNVGGRLIFPLTPDDGFGCILLVTRHADGVYAATAVTRAAFIPCIGARDKAASAALAAALQTQSLDSIRSLHRNDFPDSSAWCVVKGWWLSTAAP